MAFLTDFAYYENEGNVPNDANWGEYQYMTLDEIVDNYLATFTGNGEIVNNVPRWKVRSLAKMIVRELNQDAFKEIKVVEEVVGDQLHMILPHDYVNWVRLSLYKDGYLRTMEENIQVMSATSYLKDVNGDFLFDLDGNILAGSSNLDAERIAGTKKSIYLNPDSVHNGRWGYNVDGAWYFDYQVGGRYGLEGRTANANPTFRIDKRGGVVHFESDMSGETVVMEYVSDGMEGGNDSLIRINKMFEKYMYRALSFEILNAKDGIQEYIVRRYKQQRKAEYNNACIRIGGFNPAKVLQGMRGKDNVLK